MISMPWLSHTLNLVGENMATPILSEFHAGLLACWSSSSSAKLKWKLITKSGSPTYSTTRWWLKYEVSEQSGRSLPLVQVYVEDLVRSNVCPVNALRLSQILQNRQLYDRLRIEIAVIIDTMKEFVTTTYVMESDGFLLPFVYDRIRSLQLKGEDVNYDQPNVRAVLENILEDANIHDVASTSASLPAHARSTYTSAFQ